MYLEKIGERIKKYRNKRKIRRRKKKKRKRKGEKK
jgi:hypothetical protein